MSFLIKTAKKIRYHWKKSTFAVIVFSYGYGYLKDYIETQNLLRAYCEKAARFGRQPLSINEKPKNVTVILNPNANKRSAVDDFEKYCAPILHLAGIAVVVNKTEKEGHAKTIVQDMSNTDAIVVAGGDGTLCEVVTGLLRRTEEKSSPVPIGVLPLGQRNSLASSFFPGGSHLSKVRSLVDATMAIVEEQTRPVDVMRVEMTERDVKPIYALSGIKWGAFEDAEARKDKYWYYGPWRKYATYLFNGYKNDLTWSIDVNVNYSPPCDGCSNCSLQKSNDKWFDKFSKKNVSMKLNPECISHNEKFVQTSDLELTTSEENCALHLKIGPKIEEYLDFVKNGWRYQNSGTKEVVDKLNARQVELNPNISDEKETFFYVDNEQFEVRPVRITLLPRFISMFCKKESI